MRRSWRLVVLWMVLVVVVLSNTEGKNFSLELLNANTVEETALRKAVDDINAQLLANGSSFPVTLQIRNASQKDDLFKYSGTLASSDVIAVLDFNVLPYSACTTSTVTKIPVIRFHGGESYKIPKNCSSLTISADYVSYAQVTIQILDSFQWRKIALMVEPSRFYEAAFFESFASSKDYTLSYIQIGKEENTTRQNACMCERTMKELAASGAEVILLYVKDKPPILLMESCDPKKNYVWIIQDPVLLDTIHARESHMVIGFGHATEKGAKWSTTRDAYGLAYDAVSLVAMTLKNIHDDGLWLLSNSSGISLSNKETFYRYAKKMNTPTVQIDTKGLRIVDELRVLNLINNTFTEVGKWTKAGNILTFSDRIHFNDASLDRFMLKGRQITVVTALEEPFVMRTISSNGRFEYHGLCIEILKYLASDLKFIYTIKLVDDGFYGTLVNGKWNGLIGELIDGKAEMIVAPLTRNVQRQQYTAMTASFMYYTDKMMMKETVIEEKELFQFMSPYSTDVWLVMASMLVAIGLTVYILNYFSPYGYKNDKGTKTSEELNFFNSIWFSAACMLQQGADHAPKSISGRILAGFFWFSILVWVSTYTANLVAFFTVESFIKPVTNIEEALESGYELGVVEKSNLHALFNSTEYDLYKRAWSRMKRLPKNVSQATEWMRTSQYIHILDGPIQDYLANKNPCDLFTFPGLQSPRSYAFALRQNDPHVQEISLAIMHLRDSGFLEKLRMKYWNGFNECQNKNKKRIKNKIIQLDSVAGVFIVLGVGFLVSLIILAIEIYWYQKGRQKIHSLKEKLSIWRERNNDSNMGKVNEGTEEEEEK